MNWGTPQNIFGDCDLATDGTLVDAIALGDNTVIDVTVNGLTFHGITVPNDGVTSFATFGNYSLSSTGGPLNAYSSFGSQEAPFGMLSTGYQSCSRKAGAPLRRTRSS